MNGYDGGGYLLGSLRDMTEIGWHMYADAARSVSLAHGVIPTLWLCGDDAQVNGESGAVRLSTLHPQIVPEIKREARKLVENGGDEAVFQVERGALGLVTAADSELEGVVHCVLTMKSSPSGAEADTGSSYESWLDAKLNRAEFHRQRGNDHFKSDQISAAASEYKRALQYLACPTTRCSFSHDECEKIKTVAIPCHSNLATCYWKLGEMDACIRQSTHVLELDGAHAKGRYRRSQAYVQTKQFDEAVDDLEQVVALDPDSKLFRASLEKAKLSRQHHLSKAKQALASAFKS